MSSRHATKKLGYRSLTWILTVIMLVNGFIFVNPQIVSEAQAESQTTYRWRINDGGETGASWDAPEATPIEDFHRGESRRLRMGVSNSGSDVELLKTAAEQASMGEDFFWPAAIDQTNGFAYFGTYTQPCQVVKVRLNDFTRVGAITLGEGQNECSSAAIDVANNYAYFGLGTAPGQIARVNLTSFTQDGTLNLESGEDFLEAATIDTANGYAYFGTRTSPGRVVKVNLSTFTRDSAVTLNTGENSLLSATQDSSYVYFGTNTAPGRVIRLDKATFQRDSAITFNSGEEYLYTALMDETDGYAYFSTFTFPGSVVRVDLATFTRDDALELNNGENSIASAVIDTTGSTHYAYYGTSTSPGQVIKVDLDNFNRDDAVTLNNNEPHLFAAVLDTNNDYAYFGTFQSTPGKIVKIDTDTMSRIGSISNGAGGQNRFGAGVVDDSGEFGYFGTDTHPAKIVKVQMGSMAIIDSLTLQTGEDGIQTAVIDNDEGFVYFGTNTSPGKIIKVRMSDLSRIAVITLDSGEDKLNGAVIDDTGSTHYAYFATYTAPMQVVKVNLNSFSVVDTLTMQSGEDRNYGAAVIDPTNGYAYFGTYTAPGKIVQVDLADFTRDGAITLLSGENNLNHAVIDSASGYAYFSTFTAPGRVVKVDLNPFERTSSFVFNTGENYPGDGVIDTANGFAYWGTFWEFPAKVLKIRLSNMTRAGDLTLSNGEDRLWTAAMDQEGGYAYFGSYANPGTIYKISVAPKYDLRLEYSLNETDNCAETTGWTVIPNYNNSTTEHFEMYATAHIANETRTSNIAGGLTDYNTAFTPGYVMTTTAQAPEISLGESQFTEMEFSIQTTDDSVANGKYCFRMTDSGTLLNNYLYAEATDPTDDPTTNNTVRLSRLTVDTIASVYIEFTLQNEFDTGTLTVFFPAEFDMLSAPTSGHACLIDFSYDDTAKTLTALKGTGKGASIDCPENVPIWLDGASVRNPDTPGAYRIHWTNDDPGEAYVYIVDNDQVMVMSDVDPQLSFNVGATDSCDENFFGNGGTVALGTLDTGTIATSDKNGTYHICTRLTANSSGGSLVTVKSLNGGLNSLSVPTDTIPSVTGTLSAGTEGYGICIGSGTSDVGRRGTAGANPIPQSPFNPGTCSVHSADVAAVSNIAQTIWTLDDTAQDGFVKMFVKAAIGSLTEAHDDYADTLTFVATLTY